MGQSPRHISRRELLKRGALVGGAALWATPVVQAFGMGRAYAADTSPRCTVYCIVWQPSEPGAPSKWAVSEGDKCLPCSEDAEAVLPPDIGDFTVVYDDVAREYTVTYPDTYILVPPGDPTPDEFIPFFAAIRRGENTGSCRYENETDNLDGTRSVVFGDWDAASGDRIELVLKNCV